MKSLMGNQEKLATLGTQDTGLRQKKIPKKTQKTQKNNTKKNNQKTKKTTKNTKEQKRKTTKKNKTTPQHCKLKR